MGYSEVYSDGGIGAIVQLLILIPLSVFWLALIWEQFKSGGRRLDALSGKSMVMAPVLIIFIGICPFVLFDRFQTWRSLENGEAEMVEGTVNSFARQKTGLAFCVEVKCFQVPETENIKKIGMRDGTQVRVTHKEMRILRMEVATKK